MFLILPEFAHFGLFSKQIGPFAAELYCQNDFGNFLPLDLDL